MHLVFSCDGTWLVVGLRVQVEVYMAADLGEDVLLDPGQLFSEQVDIVAEISDYLASLIIIDVAEVSTLVGLVAAVSTIPQAVRGFLVDHPEAQDLLILLLDHLLFVCQVLPKLVKCLLNVLHVFFDSLHVDRCLLRAVVPLWAHRRAWRIEICTTALIKEGRLHGLRILRSVDLSSLLSDKLRRLQASLILFLHHVYLELVVLLQEVGFIFEPAHGLLSAHLLLLSLGLQLCFQVLVLLLELLKDLFFVQ